MEVELACEEYFAEQNVYLPQSLLYNQDISAHTEMEATVHSKQQCRLLLKRLAEMLHQHRLYLCLRACLY